MSSKSERRDRVEELFGYTDRYITDKLIEEGLFVQPDDCRTDAAQERWRSSCRRTVNNDRHAIRKGWKAGPAPTLGDVVATREFVARMKTRLADLEVIVNKVSTKPTAKMNGYAEMRQLETLIAQASGVDIHWKRFMRGDGGGDGTPPPPFIGLYLDTSNLSQETKDLIANETGQGKPGPAGKAAKAAKVQVQ